MQYHCLIVVPCLPSPCINNGTCVAVNSTSQELICNCIGIYSGNFCEFGDKVCVTDWQAFKLCNIIANSYTGVSLT